MIFYHKEQGTHCTECLRCLWSFIVSMWNVSGFDHPDFLWIWGLGLTRLYLFLSGLCLSFIYFSLHGLVGLIIYSHIKGWNYVGTCQTFHWLSTEPTATLLSTRTQGRASWDCQIQVSRFWSNGVYQSSGVFKYFKKKGVWHFKMFYDFFYFLSLP